MNFRKRAANARPELIFAIILVFYGILIFKIKNVGPVYGDSGLMYLQVKQIVDSHYSTFAFDYKGKTLDDQYRYAPYKKPFLAGVGEKHYIDFPPYYPLFGAPFYQLFGMRGLYVPGFLAIAGLLFLLIRFGKLFSFSHFQINSVLFLYSFASTPNLYSLVFHEYPVALLAITCALFYLSKYVFSEEKKIYLILFGLFSGISLFFRLELIFVIIPAGISTLIILRKNFVLIPALSLAGFLVPFIALLVLNQHIHGHPLGLRYYLTLTDNVSPDLKERMGIIYRMLFSETRGLFRQNPYYLFSFAFLPWLFKSRDNRIKFLYLILLFSSILILVTSPNDGDHIAPRYLFGILTVGTILFILVIASFPEKTAIRRILYFLVIVTVAISVRE
ncbi:MAG: hypothetical protein K8R21_15345, partial [Leptospira sp.]|nr:hypothetical protein [Leptospira sp.]